MILTLKLKIQAPQTLGLHKEMRGDQNVIRPLKIFIGRCGPPPSAVSTAREVGPTGQHRSVRGYLREGGEGGSKRERRKKDREDGSREASAATRNRPQTHRWSKRHRPLHRLWSVSLSFLLFNLC